jgi:hypothetical protein
MEKSLQKHCESQRIKLRPCIRMYIGKDGQDTYLGHKRATSYWLGLLFGLFGGEIRRATYLWDISHAVRSLLSKAERKEKCNTIKNI